MSEFCKAVCIAERCSESMAHVPVILEGSFRSLKSLTNKSSLSNLIELFQPLISRVTTFCLNSYICSAAGF